MLKSEMTQKPMQPVDWFTAPQVDHVVHFYPIANDLIEALARYISAGLILDETCIVIAKPDTFIPLHKKLRAQGIGVDEAISKGQYITYDACELLANFMNKGQPRLDVFLDKIGKVVTYAAGRNKPVRAFGEMVAILLEQRNFTGTLNLEKYWNELALLRDFSLYCAYPQLAFEGNHQMQELFRSICCCHERTVGI
jgi:hypothetical protein